MSSALLDSIPSFSAQALPRTSATSQGKILINKVGPFGLRTSDRLNSVVLLLESEIPQQKGQLMLCFELCFEGPNQFDPDLLALSPLQTPLPGVCFCSEFQLCSFVLESRTPAKPVQPEQILLLDLRQDGLTLSLRILDLKQAIIFWKLGNKITNARVFSLSYTAFVVL